jgi:hypothetical protein
MLALNIESDGKGDIQKIVNKLKKFFNNYDKLDLNSLK